MTDGYTRGTYKYAGGMSGRWTHRPAVSTTEPSGAHVQIFGEPGYYGVAYVDKDDPHGQHPIAGCFHYKRDAIDHAKRVAVRNACLIVWDATEPRGCK